MRRMIRCGVTHQSHDGLRDAGGFVLLADLGFCVANPSYLPMQKLEKIRPSRSSELKAPVISPSAC